MTWKTNHIEYRACKSKIRYRDYNHAMKEAKKIYSRTGEKLYPYECRFCMYGRMCSMTIRKYLRTDSDCILLYRNEDNSRLGECQALIYDAFEQYVFKGECGTDKCPFYKKNGKVKK